ncbi:MAG: recombinase family protein [Eubacteriales bacterium]
MLTNEKYTGTSVYGSTVSHDYPSTKRSTRKSDDIHRSENHHPAIIDQVRFDQIQKLKKERSNVVVDGAGNRVRKPTHYSMKHPKKAPKIIKKPFNDKPHNLTK